MYVPQIIENYLLLPHEFLCFCSFFKNFTRSFYKTKIEHTVINTFLYVYRKCLFACEMIYYLWKYFQSYEKGFRRLWPGGILNHILVLTVHTLQPLSYLAERWDVFNGLHDQVIPKLNSSLGDCVVLVPMTLAANLFELVYT